MDSEESTSSQAHHALMCWTSAVEHLPDTHAMKNTVTNAILLDTELLPHGDWDLEASSIHHT